MKLKTNKTFTKGLRKKKKLNSEFEIPTTKRIKLSFYRDEKEKEKISLTTNYQPNTNTWHSKRKRTQTPPTR